AVKFTEPGGRIIMRADGLRDDQNTVRAHFSVIDTGRGIPKEYQEKIFEAFHQGESSAARLFGGTGLGLTISANLVRLMGGHLELESELGAGSVFSFEIPFKVGRELPSHSLNAPVASQENEISFEKLQALNVLVVEDNVINQKVFVRILDKFGCTTTVAE